MRAKREKPSHLKMLKATQDGIRKRAVQPDGEMASAHRGAASIGPAALAFLRNISP